MCWPKRKGQASTSPLPNIWRVSHRARTKAAFRESKKDSSEVRAGANCIHVSKWPKFSVSVL